METYLVLCPTHRDLRELPRVAPNSARLLFHDYGSLALEDMVGPDSSSAPELPDPLEEIDRILARFAKEQLSGVVSSDDYPGSTLACAVARRLGLPGTDPAINLICQHKYYSRAYQQLIVPEAVPMCALIDVNGPPMLPSTMELPAFAKPVKSFFSIGAESLKGLDQLAVMQRRWKSRAAFFRPFEQLLERYTGFRVGSCQRRPDSRPAGRSKSRPVAVCMRIWRGARSGPSPYRRRWSDQGVRISPVSGLTSSVAWFCSALAAERRRPVDCLRR
jgi:hypothetical protein